MASSSVEHGAALSRAPPPPDQLTTFYKLVDKRVTAGVLCREARDADLSAQASLQAEALFGEDSLAVARLRMNESMALTNLACEASGAESDALLRKSWAVLVSVVNLLMRRLADNTVLPGTIREEELDYSAHVQAVVKKTKNKAVRSPARLRALASTMGYETLLQAMYGSLYLLPASDWSTVQMRIVESFVLRGLDVIPRTTGIPADLIIHEDDLVVIIKEHMTPRNYGSDFCAAVLRKWLSDAVSSVLCARGILQTGVAKVEQNMAEFEALQRADIAKHGLRDCALPFCSKTEKTVKEFSLCAGCRSQVYCCLEHQALDWKAHKKACKEKEAARRAEEEADNEATGGGAALA